MVYGAWTGICVGARRSVSEDIYHAEGVRVCLLGVGAGGVIIATD